MLPDHITSNSCRVCFSRCKRSDVKVKEVADVFYQTTGLSINLTDIPTKICESCLKKLKKAFKFKQACIRAGEILESYRQKVTTEPKKEIDTNDDRYSKDECLIDDKLEISHLKCEINNWKYETLEQFLYEQNRTPSEIELFVLNYGKNRPMVEHLPPNIDIVDENIKEHEEKITSGCEDTFKCTCGTAFDSLDRLRLHSSTKICNNLPLTSPLQCNRCQFTCCTGAFMELHWIKMHSEQHILEICQCGTKFYCDDLKLEHLLFVCQFREKHLQIPFGEMIVNKVNVVNVGIRKMKTKSKKPKKEKQPQARVICELCGKELLKSRLSDHIGAKHNAKRFECDLCNSSYVEKANLIRHMFYKHLKNQRQYPCPYCDKIYEQSGSRSLHIKKIHTNDLPHVCEVCGKRFVKPSKLKYHLAIHSDIRNVPCSQCDSMFKSIKDLMGHRSAVHSNRIYTCQICAETFKNSRLLKVHKATHGQ